MAFKATIRNHHLFSFRVGLRTSQINHYLLWLQLPGRTSAADGWTLPPRPPYSSVITITKWLKGTEILSFWKWRFLKSFCSNTIMGFHSTSQETVTTCTVKSWLCLMFTGTRYEAIMVFCNIKTKMRVGLFNFPDRSFSGEYKEQKPKLISLLPLLPVAYVLRTGV